MPACDDDDASSTGTQGDETQGTDGMQGTGGTGDDATSGGTAWYFTTDAISKSWGITIADAANPAVVVATLNVAELAALTGPDVTPSWGDALPGPHGRRVFANAGAAGQIAVFDATNRSLETMFPGFVRPLHMWNPNHGNEIWSHDDGTGAFSVIDATTLAVSAPIPAALEATGHGKLLYGAELGTKYFATNTNDAGAFPIDGAAKTSGPIIPLCAVQCVDDPDTADVDESLAGVTCGATHDKAYNPRFNMALFQCSGDAGGHYAFVNAATNAVIQDMVPITGSVSHSPNNEYIVLTNAAATVNQLQIWNTQSPTHDGFKFDALATVGGSPSARGMQFHHRADGAWEAWIPQTSGTDVVVLNLATMVSESVYVGTLTKPEGAQHFERRAAISGTHLFTYNDLGIVFVDLATRVVSQGPALAGVGRVEFVPAAAH